MVHVLCIQNTICYNVPTVQRVNDDDFKENEPSSNAITARHKNDFEIANTIQYKAQLRCSTDFRTF